MDTSVAKRLKLEVRKFERLIPTFVDVAVEKLGGGFLTSILIGLMSLLSLINSHFGSLDIGISASVSA